jgi:hypothetical protein
MTSSIQSSGKIAIEEGINSSNIVVAEGVD